MDRLMSKCTLMSCIIFVFAGCSSAGPMDVKERYYLLAENDLNAVLYRVTIRAETKRADAKYYSGRYPESAIDAVFGDVSDTAEATARATAKNVQDQIAESITILHQEFVNGVKAGESAAQLKTRLERLQLVRLLPSPDSSIDELGKSARIIEYNPMQSTVTFRDGTKQVIFLSADPDKVIGALDNFTRSAKSAAAIDELVQTIAASNQNEKLSTILTREYEAAEEKKLSSQLKAATKRFDNPINDTEAKAILRALAEGVSL